MKIHLSVTRGKFKIAVRMYSALDYIVPNVSNLRNTSNCVHLIAVKSANAVASTVLLLCKVKNTVPLGLRRIVQVFAATVQIQKRRPIVGG